MHRTILKCPRRSISGLFSGSVLPIRGKQNGPFSLETFQTVAGSKDPSTFCFFGDTVTNSLGLQVVTALQLGHRSQASDILSGYGAASRELNAEDIIYILEYCARSPDPLFVMETWRVLEGRNIAVSWKCYMLIARALSNGGYLEEALQLVKFVGENNRISFILPLHNSFLSASAKMKDARLFNQCVNLMEQQYLGKNEVTYSALLKLAVWQNNLAAVHEMWRELRKHYNVNIISLRKFIWSFTRLNDLKSAYRTLQRMVKLSMKEGTLLRRTLEGKIYCPQLDIPIPLGSVMSVVGFDLHRDQLASPVSSDGRKLILNTSEGVAKKKLKKLKASVKLRNKNVPRAACNTSKGLHCSPFSSDNNIDDSTKIESLDDHKKGLIKKILRWSFNDVIHACGHLRRPKLAQQLIVQMQNLGLEPSSHTYDGLVKAKVSRRRISTTMKLLKEMQNKKLKPYDSTLSILSRRCSKALKLDLAETLLNRIAARNSLLPYNAFFKACDVMDQPERAVKMFAKMRKRNIKPNIRTYELIFSLFGNVNAPYEEGNLLSHADVAKRINAIEMDMLENGIHHSQRSMHSLLKALGSEGMVQEMLYYFHRAESQFSVNDMLGTKIYNTVLHSLVEANETQKAIEIFSNIKLCGIQLDAVTYTIMIDCCSNIRCFKSACALLSMMIRVGFPPEIPTYTALIKILLQYDAFDYALDLLDQAISEGSETDVVLFNTIIVKASFQGRIDVIETVVQAMHQEKIQPTHSTCNFVFSAYVKQGFHGTALEALQVLSLRMISLDHEPLKNMRRDYKHLVFAEEEEAETQILQHFRDSENLAVALLNLRLCAMAGATISWEPDLSPWAVRLANASTAQITAVL